jgi:hypothetical protein
MPDNEAVGLRREVLLESLKARLITLAIDPVYALGLVSDPMTIEKLAFDENGRTSVDLAAVAKELASKAPRHAFRPESLESSQDWARRKFGDESSALDSYISRTYRRPSVTRTESKK